MTNAAELTGTSARLTWSATPTAACGCSWPPTAGTDPDRAVGLLVVFEQGDDGAADGDGGAVEGVEGTVAVGGSDSAGDAAGLVVGAVGGRGELAEGALG